ncbi:hypothetical protein K443DRAFT_100282 [Laccaria amethystina LaAM-08-1]|uniref:Uncharacterized protein n=1 Tax=Laccaria amethystina LaAM-08-1 TaxID=1095629 RepID=A0A0C9X684_9AGAR|nr:hypothetical protein K443DRAFT_100282 [Laccaria amethystina LaAM-08-1]
MRSLLTFFTILISSLLMSALTSASPSPSAVPCVYKCPTKDTANHNLGGHVETNFPIYCQYGEGYCLYDKTTGLMTSDHESGHCPSKAICATVSRRAPLPQSPRQKFARQVDTSELKVRDQLGSAKRGKRSV